MRVYCRADCDSPLFAVHTMSLAWCTPRHCMLQVPCSLHLLNRCCALLGALTACEAGLSGVQGKAKTRSQLRCGCTVAMLSSWQDLLAHAITGCPVCLGRPAQQAPAPWKHSRETMTLQHSRSICAQLESTSASGQLGDAPGMLEAAVSLTVSS